MREFWLIPVLAVFVVLNCAWVVLFLHLRRRRPRRPCQVIAIDSYRPRIGSASSSRAR